METQRPQNIQMVNDPILDYQPSEEEIEYMINNDPEVKAKASQLITDLSLIEEQRSTQLADFIRMKNDQALDDMISSIKKGQKRPRKPSQAQVIAEMKKFLCTQAGWKMTQLKGKRYEELQALYYKAFRRNKYFIPVDS